MKTETPKIEELRKSTLYNRWKAYKDFEEKAKPYLDQIARWIDKWSMLIEEALVCNQWYMKYENETTEEDI